MKTQETMTAMTLKTLPKISIVTPSYNQGDYLEDTIQSVLDQSYQNLEYIIIDGGSTDNSVNIIKKYEKYLAYWVSEKDQGQSHAINKGFSHATGDIFAWLNSDDCYMTEALDCIVSTYIKNKNYDIFVGTGQIVDAHGNALHNTKPPGEITVESIYNWFNGSDFVQPSCFFTKEAWLRSGPLDENIHIALDVDLWLRMAISGCKYLSVDKVISSVKWHEKAKTTEFKNLMFVDASLVIAKHGGGNAVRNILEEMAIKLTWYEKRYESICSNKLLKFVTSLTCNKSSMDESKPRWKSS